jgi:hypothetical protein
MVAWLALALALVNSAWQVFAWWSRRRPTGLVSFEQSLRGRDDESGGVDWIVEITVVNRGETPFTVAQVGIAHVAGDPAVWQDAADAAPGRVLLGPGDSLHREFDGRTLHEWFGNAPLVGVIRLASGPTIASSPPQGLDPEFPRRLAGGARRVPGR